MSSTGGDSTAKLINSINTALKSAQDITKSFNREVGGSVKVISNIAREFDRLDKSLAGAAKNIRSVSTALNSLSTDKGAKSLQGYIDGLEIATLYIRDLSEEASKAKPLLDSLVSSKSLSNTDALANFIEQIYFELIELNATSRESIETLDRLADRITDVEVQTKKTRLETEKARTSFDQYGNAIRNTGTQASRQSKSVEKLTNDTRRLAGAGSQGARAFSDLAFRMNPLVSLYASIAVNVYALSEAFRILKEASALDRLYTQTARFSAAMTGINVEGLSKQLVELSGNAINAGDALRQAVRGVSYGFTVSELEKLTLGARRASVALGIDFADAYDRAIRGIAKQEVELLDEIGVVTRLDSAMQKYARTLGVTAESLTDTQRTAALAEEVIDQLDKKFSSFTTSATGMEQLGVATKNAIDSLTIATSRLVNDSSITKWLVDVLNGFSRSASASELAAQSLKTYNEAISSGNFIQATKAQAEYVKYLELARKQQDKNTKEGKAFLLEQEKQAKSTEALNVVIGLATLAAAKYAVTVGAALITSVIAATTAFYKKVVAVVAYTTATTAMGLVVNGGILAIRAITAAVALSGAAFRAAAVGGVAAFGKALFLASLPLLKFVAIVGGIGLIVAVAGKAILDLAKFLGPGVLSSAIDLASEALGWLGDKLKEFLSFLGRESKEAGRSFLGIPEAAKETVNTVNELNLNKLQKEFSSFSLTSAMQLKELYEAGKLSEKAIASITSVSNAGSVQLVRGLNGMVYTLEEAGEQALLFNRGIKSSGDAALDLARKLRAPKTGLEEIAEALAKLTPNTNWAAMATQNVEALRVEFDKLKEAGALPRGVTEFSTDAFKNAAENLMRVSKSLKEVAQSQQGVSLAQSILTAKVGEEQSSRLAIAANLAYVRKEIQLQSQLASKISEEEIKKLRLKESELLVEQSLLELKSAQQRIDHESTLASIALTAQLDVQQAGRVQYLDNEISILNTKRLQYEQAKLSTVEIEKQLAVLEAQKKAEQDRQAAELARGRQQNASELAQGVLGIKADQAGSESKRLEIEKQILEIRRLQVEAMPANDTQQILAKEAAQAQLLLDQLKMGTSQGAQAQDFSGVLGAIGNIEGLTDLQSTFSTSLSSISDTYSQFLDSMGSESSSFADFLKGDIEALGNVMQASVSLAQQAFATMSQAKIDGISREIEAEKRRDGKSAESQAKIKQLEAKRIKEEAKAKKASVIMSTAAAIMQVMSQMPFPANIAVAAAYGAMGAMQIGQIDKAANGQLAGLNDGSGGNLSISGGNRSNSIDVSKTANAGELAYLQGKQGTGTAQNFTPGRAGGGFASAGTSITVGESGPEVITPAVPVNVERSGKSGGGSSIVFSPQYNLSSVDTQGMEELLERHSTALYKGLEKELLARNLSLENL